MSSGDRDGFDRIVRLTSEFYRWEERGRGWQVWPYTVELEPPFRPFSHGQTTPTTPTDDARKQSGIGGWLRSMLFRDASTTEQPEEESEPEAIPADVDSVVELTLTLSPETKVSAELSEQFLLSISTTARPVSFEIIATESYVVVQVACTETDREQVRDQVRAFFPDTVVTESAGNLAALWKDSAAAHLVVDFGLSEEFMRPLQTFSKFDTDPHIGLIGSLGELAEGEAVVFQVLFHSVRESWQTSIMRSVTDLGGDGFFVDVPELVSLAKEKTKRPLFAVVPRVAVQASTSERAWMLARRLGGALAQFARPGSNELLALSNDDYLDEVHIEDVLRRTTHRTGCLLNSEELVSLVHPPSTAVRTPKLRRHERRTKAAPKELLGQELVLGQNIHAGQSTRVGIGQEQRLRHVHLVGSSGTGKSTLLLHCIVQDMEAGRGLALIDPHGDLVEQVLERVPANRRSDVILVDPSDVERPVGFNILSAHSELERTLLSSDLVAVFKRLSTSWGDQMTSVLGNAVLAFLESSRGGTLADLRRFLIEPDFRKSFLGTVQDQEVVYFWQKEFPLLHGKPQASLLTRLDTFLRPKPIRNMVSQQENRLDFASIMNDGRILLVKLSQGLIGEENAALLGSLIVSKIHQTALSRQSVAEDNRRPFYVYLDEFQNFVTPSMATLLTGARKYRVGLVLAHQELRQLWNQDRDVAGAVLANAGTRISFRVGVDDAKALAENFSTFKAEDLQNLRVGEAVCRVDRADSDFSLDTVRLPAIDRVQAQAVRDEVVALSRERYGSTPPFSPAVVSMPTPEPASETRPKPRPVARSEEPSAAATSQKHSESPRISTPGRGGAQHKYLQQLIKRWAEANGWSAAIEQSILDGLGSVDVGLHRDGVAVACEISVTSTTLYEVGNIQKCLSAGFDHVVSIVLDVASGQKIRSALRDLDTDLQPRVQVLRPEELFEYLSNLSSKPDDASQTSTVRGYSVRVNRKQASGADRNRSIGQTMVAALKRIKKG